jgi:1,4-alpha-glucan branching enzyme
MGPQVREIIWMLVPHHAVIVASEMPACRQQLTKVCRLRYGVCAAELGELWEVGCDLARHESELVVSPVCPSCSLQMPPSRTPIAVYALDALQLTCLLAEQRARPAVTDQGRQEPPACLWGNDVPPGAPAILPFLPLNAYRGRRDMERSILPAVAASARPARPSKAGYLALVLHAHMPYVEGFETSPHGEAWLWEGLTDVYLPLLDVLRGAPVTVGLTPVLCDQLETLRGAPGERFLIYLDAKIASHTEDAAEFDRAGEHALASELRRAAGDYLRARRTFLAVDRDVIGAWRRLTATGKVAAMSSAATHAVLPLLGSMSRGLQLDLGTRSHRRRFGQWTGAMWLPECGFQPGLEHELAAVGVHVYCVEQTDALGLGAFEHLEPIATPSGPVALPIDWETVALVWDRATGYPTAAAYRDHHTRRTSRGLKPWAYDGSPYRHGEAVGLAHRHAAEFVQRVKERLDSYRAIRGRPGVVCCALDAELIGHWWYEGTAWLAAVLQEAHERGLELVTLPEAARRVEAIRRPIGGSTWAPSRDFGTWDSPRLSELSAATRHAERAVERALTSASQAALPALARAVRELLALQASDWAFQITHGWAGDYPVRRWRGHATGVASALELAQTNGSSADARLRNLAPDLDLSFWS